MESKHSGERRHIIGIMLMAKAGSRYAMTLTPDHQHIDWYKIGNSYPIIPAALVDDRMHMVWSIQVERVKDGVLQPMTLSRACRLSNLTAHIRRQEEAGIVPGDDAFLNPLGYWHKDVLVALALSGKTLSFRTDSGAATKEAKSVLNIYRQAELQLIEIAE